MSTLKKRIRIAAPLGAVRSALTDPAAMRVWLAEHVEVDLPDRYEFWGRFTPNGAAPHQRLRHVDDTSLRFDWDLDGISTAVDIALATEPGSGEDSGSTLLTFTQTEVPGWPEVLTETGDRSLMHTYWALALANLADHIEGRDPVGGCDFSSPVLRRDVLIAADRQAVFASLTESEHISKWFGVKVEAELYPGGRWAMGGFDVDGDPARIIDIQPGRSMSVDWGEMIASWEVADAGGGRTRLTFFRSGYDETQPPYDGWLGSLSGLAELRRYHEMKNWRPMWAEVQIEGTPDGLLTNN
jgi:uncharacterized protein YndB with AHSA1/START domain